MKPIFTAIAVLALCCALPGLCQQNPAASGSVPLYRVTVVERSVDAINYQYRSEPTKIDFQGTVLLPKAKGDAVVESRQGRTEIDAKFDNLAPPTRFGREYLTYVLWAISPEGAPHNLGEVIPDGGDHAKIRVTSDLQVFGLIVTAEPFSAVRQPSDVVVLENRVRPDTVGKVQPIQAKYELMPRGQYTYQVQDSLASGVASAPKVSMQEYEATLELYQAQNAIAIARAANAEQYAPNTFAKAQQALQEAQRLSALKGNTSLVVQNAREAAQTAEDARVIARRRMQDEQLAKAQADALQAQQAKTNAEAEAQRLRAEADAARATAQAERAAREQAEANARIVQDRANQVQADRLQPTTVPASPQPQNQQTAKTEARMRLLERFNGVMQTRDTPRGLVVTVPDSAFSGSTLRSGSPEALRRLATVIAAQPGLRVAVEGYSDSSDSSGLSQQRADAVRAVLANAGLPAAAISSQGLGNSRPLTSNATEAGRIENRRVEIVISGDPIGTLPFWDRTYSLNVRQ